MFEHKSMLWEINRKFPTPKSMMDVDSVEACPEEYCLAGAVYMMFSEEPVTDMEQTFPHSEKLADLLEDYYEKETGHLMAVEQYVKLRGIVKEVVKYNDGNCPKKAQEWLESLLKFLEDSIKKENDHESF